MRRLCIGQVESLFHHNIGQLVHAFGQDAIAHLSDENIVLIMHTHRSIGDVLGPAFVGKQFGGLFGEFARADGEHGLDCDERARFARLHAFGPLASVGWFNVRDVRRPVQPRLVVIDKPVAAHCANQVKAVFAFDATLHFASPREIRLAGYELLHASSQALFAGFHQLRDLLAGLAEDVCPTGIADPAFVRNADVNLEYISLVHRALQVTVPAVHDALIDAETRVTWKWRQLAPLRRIPEKAALGFLVGDLLAYKCVNLRECQATFEERGEAAMALNNDLCGGEGSVGFRGCRYAILDWHETEMIGTCC